jgi:hypothetical protein
MVAIRKIMLLITYNTPAPELVTAGVVKAMVTFTPKDNPFLAEFQLVTNDEYLLL